MTDNWYDAWHAYVDGQPAKLLRSYGTFRAVAVPAGTETVAFKYRSERYTTGRLVTWLATLFVLGVIGFYFIQPRLARRKENEPDEA